MSDLSLQQRIVEELHFDPQVDSAHIGIVVDKGVVTLTGHVADYAQKLAAEEAVRRVKGVRAVAEQLEVRVANHKRTADDEIATRIADLFAWDARIPESQIRIKVRDGWAYLDGEVAWNFQRREAQDQASKLSGLVGVINNIKVREKPPVSGIRRRIEEAFLRNAAIDAEAIDVSVDGRGAVKLEGIVHSWPERAAAENAAWSVPGVTRLESNLRIS
jgi:osmotically-inducible protein OsmY